MGQFCDLSDPINILIKTSNEAKSRIQDSSVKTFDDETSTLLILSVLDGPNFKLRAEHLYLDFLSINSYFLAIFSCQHLIFFKLSHCNLTGVQGSIPAYLATLKNEVEVASGDTVKPWVTQGTGMLFESLHGNKIICHLGYDTLIARILKTMNYHDQGIRHK